MLKTFTLDNRVDEKLSDTSGTVIFSITDEHGVSRDIFAKTFLDENQIPQGVTASNKRELPLVEGLFRMEIGELTTIDFTLYNETFKRDINKTPNQIAYDEIIASQKKNSLLSKAAELFKVKLKKKNKEEEAVTS